MSNTFTTQDMKDYGDYVATLDSAMLSPNFEKWCKERFEPTKKVIDLSVLIDSQIDCEFYDELVFDEEQLRISFLTSIDCSRYPYSLGCDVYRFCRPRMNHIHSWQGDKCPLPEGFMVKVWWRDKQHPPEVREASENYWELYNEESDIIAFEVLGLADGYVMPWGQDNG